MPRLRGEIDLDGAPVARTRSALLERRPRCIAVTTPAPATRPPASAATQPGNSNHSAAPATTAAATRDSSTETRYLGMRMVARASHTSPALPATESGDRSRRDRPPSTISSSTIAPITAISDGPTMISGQPVDARNGRRNSISRQFCVVLPLPLASSTMALASPGSSSRSPTSASAASETAWT